MAKTVQNTLTIKVNDKEVQSKPFDFEAYRLVENLNQKGNWGPSFCCYDALIRMFADTAATEQYIETLSLVEKGTLCGKIFDMYVKAAKEIQDSLKNE